MAELMLMSLLLLAGLFLSVKRVRRHFYAQKACRGREFKSQQRCLMCQKPSLLKACMLGFMYFLAYNKDRYYVCDVLSVRLCLLDDHKAFWARKSR
jgi:hypothetical protein